MLILVYPGCLWNVAGSFTFWAGWNPLSLSVPQGSWWGEGGDSGVGNSGYAKRSSPEATATGDRKG